MKRTSILRWLAPSLAAGWLAACGPSRESAPPGILPRDSLVPVLVDFHLANARAQAGYLADATEKQKEFFYAEALQRHGITYQRLRESMDYYAQRPDQLTAVYDSVIVALSRKQAETAARREDEK
jgi:hypothetical protein